MRPSTLAIGGFLALPFATFAQPATAPTIIPCEGPNMPALCPKTSGDPRSLATERSMISKRETFMIQQAQQGMMQRQALARGMTPAIAMPASPPAYQTFQSNPYLAPIAPPDLRAAARIVGNVISGGPHN
jgi:hypothetical protein